MQQKLSRVELGDLGVRRAHKNLFQKNPIFVEKKQYELQGMK
mgnify:CR=1 FL=1